MQYTHCTIAHLIMKRGKWMLAISLVLSKSRWYAEDKLQFSLLSSDNTLVNFRLTDTDRIDNSTLCMDMYRV